MCDSVSLRYLHSCWVSRGVLFPRMSEFVSTHPSVVFRCFVGCIRGMSLCCVQLCLYSFALSPDFSVRRVLPWDIMVIEDGIGL